MSMEILKMLNRTKDEQEKEQKPHEAGVFAKIIVGAICVGGALFIIGIVYIAIDPVAMDAFAKWWEGR